MSSTDSLPLFDLAAGPDFSIETKLLNDDRRRVAGVDEAGRGPLAGPVVAAAVVLDPNRIPFGLNDSKKLTERKRELLFGEICKNAHVAWCSASPAQIDTLNIRGATLYAMTKSVLALPVIADCVLVDGRDVPPDLVNYGQALVKGDARSVSIAAASIIAKVIRDRMMKQAAIQFPLYGFEKHKGYGSKVHRDAIRAHGPCSIHRRSFAPIKDMI